MHFTQSSRFAITSTEINRYFSAQTQQIPVELKPLIAKKIKVERVGFTRNASNTPYIVYRVGERRCCTFIKRKVFTSLIQKLLKFTHGITESIRSLSVNSTGGVQIKTMSDAVCIECRYVVKFLENYNTVALNSTVPTANCDCNDKDGMCVHAIARLFVSLSDRLPAFTFSAEAPIKPIRFFHYQAYATKITAKI
ncbi:hypothetical protein [Gloeocapsopsis dulcis]|uniref:SWIM-type domain-containing protein n=1 Tax=Gloeocapsopsis dulcis AAB1 = 1H9 TaxID=1433147 RepID=A0A6N8FS69_9CHRO|nr:hypothetical protein [Gloeocapsopsis dulcis]MUL35933.1 hypothetical protein [Gloeocapsopsis dulcis AAB1 = 1H9]WNN88191.1 hypothetical protein P0S91_18080 [Gloeocapsopsis dulcis]